ncbi:MAG: hypothetical protein KF778_15365 [Rhodocyclaceae bacterium]|nr:hypothetical protein [Rhodocyclaceae bacterium]MBX3669779.1 hypothetical protein [Rhodocyclaceae bacterium]
MAAALSASAWCAGPQDAEARTARWLEAHRDRPTWVRQFVQRMPKGADLHTHASGAVYAESYIAWSLGEGACYEVAKKLIAAPPCQAEQGRPPLADALKTDGDLYGALVDSMSVRNLAFAGQSGHDQFFDAFARFRGGSKGDQVAEIATRAASQQVTYLEIMLTAGGSKARDLAKTLQFDGDFAALRDKLLAAGLADAVPAGRKDIDDIETRVADLLGCAGAAPHPGCAVERRYLQQTTRIFEPAQVFAQFLYGFELARADRRVVGLNLVAPEDNPVALRDYSLQMRMLKYLKTLYPEVPLALHAGELKLGMVPPEHLRFHIREAVQVAGARRIGHGVDVLNEDHAASLLADMKKRDVAVEICLSSNDVILGVAGADHPFPDYLAAGVPALLASDDEGVSRIDLSNEYQRAALTYKLTYRKLKDLSRNSLRYSFLAGEALWNAAGRIHPACSRQRPGMAEARGACADFLAGSDKARAQWRLEGKFAEFETLGWTR